MWRSLPRSQRQRIRSELLLPGAVWGRKEGDGGRPSEHSGVRGPAPSRPCLSPGRSWPGHSRSATARPPGRPAPRRHPHVRPAPPRARTRLRRPRARARCSLPPRRSCARIAAPRAPRAAPRRTAHPPAAGVGELPRAQRGGRRRRGRSAASPGGDVAGRGPLRQAGAATGRPVRRRRGRPRRSARTRHGLRPVLAEQVQ